MDIRQKIFEMRSYTPIPFVLAMLIFAHPTVASLAAGLMCALLGEAIRFWGVSIAGSETRTTGTVGASHLVTEGPFGFVRNPLYVGNMLIYFGFGVMSNVYAPWLALCALVFFAVQYHLIVSREEEHLCSAFGEEYQHYCENVPRFIPRVTRYVGEHSFHRAVDLKRGLHSERRTLQAFTILSVVLIVKFFLG